MKTRILGIVVAVMALWAVHGWALTKRPMRPSNARFRAKPASKDHARDFDGGKVYFCCEKCPVAFEKDRDEIRRQGPSSNGRHRPTDANRLPLHRQADQRGADGRSRRREGGFLLCQLQEGGHRNGARKADQQGIYRYFEGF